MENLRNKILELFAEYVEFEKIVKDKNKLISDRGSTVQELVKGKSPEELEDVLVHIYVDTILYNKDLQMLFFKLIVSIEIYMEFSKEELPKEVLEFYNNMKNWAPKRVFVIEKNNLVETETGILDKARKEFLESDFFKGLLKEVSK